jgi:hypothetical protein
MHTNRSLSRLYKEYFEWLVRFLDEYDPIAILNDENPGCEYDIEARKMIPLVAAGLSREALAVRVHAVFVDYFGSLSAGDRSIYVPIADAMLEKWRELRTS